MLASAGKDVCKEAVSAFSRARKATPWVGRRKPGRASEERTGGRDDSRGTLLTECRRPDREFHESILQAIKEFGPTHTNVSPQKGDRRPRPGTFTTAMGAAGQVQPRRVAAGMVAREMVAGHSRRSTENRTPEQLHHHQHGPANVLLGPWKPCGECLVRGVLLDAVEPEPGPDSRQTKSRLCAAGCPGG
jgi:hypothetical protein